MKKPARILIYLLLILITYSIFKAYRIGTKDWKFSDGGAVLGDFPTFDFSLYGLFNDTLYNNNVPVAKLISYQYRVIDDVIVIKSLENNSKGRYVSKGSKN